MSNPESEKINILISKPLLESVNKDWKTRGFSSRDEFIRYAIRNTISHQINADNDSNSVLKKGGSETNPNNWTSQDRHGSGSNLNRPDPNQSKNEEKLIKFFDGKTLKAQAWLAAESERLSRTNDQDEALKPEVFWNEFGSNIWGNTISKSEFLETTTDDL